jgi:glycine cleavage system protein P-like pyridoxal-binding family
MGPQNHMSPGTKCHLDVGLVERHKIYYKGEGGGFPQVQAVVRLVNLNQFVPRPSTKNAPTMD